MKKSVAVPLLSGLVLLLLLIRMPRLKATDSPLVRVVNPTTGDGWFNLTTHDKNVGDTFLVDVTVDNVTNLSSWQVALTWNMSLLEYVSGVMILFYDSLVPELRPPPYFTNETLYAGGSAGPGPSFNGSAVMVELVLRVLGIGQCNLTLESDTFLLDDHALSMPFTPLNASYRYYVSPDVNDDGTVNMKEVALAVTAFNSFPGKPNWNPYCDLNSDGRVNIRDIMIIVLNFNKHE